MTLDNLYYNEFDNNIYLKYRSIFYRYNKNGKIVYGEHLTHGFSFICQIIKINNVTMFLKEKK